MIAIIFGRLRKEQPGYPSAVCSDTIKLISSTGVDSQRCEGIAAVGKDEDAKSVGGRVGKSRPRGNSGRVASDEKLRGTNNSPHKPAESPPAEGDAEDKRGELDEGALIPIVGVGASAGGLEAFTQLLKALPLDTGMGFVLVQHLDPEHESATEL